MERTPSGKSLRLKVPGLAEKRPSLMYGDSVFVTLPNEKVTWEGCVHTIERETVLLQFDRRFHSNYIGQRCRIRVVLPVDC
jgi:helicase MOV-10